MNIEEVRSKYPQYNDLSDEQLLTGIHNKYYSDIPIDDFMANFTDSIAAVEQPEVYGDSVQSQPETETSKLGELSERLKQVPGNIGRQLGRTGRITADALAAIPLTAMDAGVGARNLYSEISNLNRPSLSTDYSQTHPSYRSLYEQSMNDVDFLPPAEGTGEEVVDFLGQMAVGSKAFPNIGIKKPAPQPRQLFKSPAEKAIQAGEAHNVPVHYDDVAGNAAKRVNIAAERIPLVGTAGGKEAQQKAVNKAVQKLSDKHYVEDDIPDLVQKGLQDKLNNARKAAGKLYDDVEKLLSHRGQVPSKSFDDEILNQMAKQEELGTAANPEVMKILDRFASAPRGDFGLMRKLRSKLGREISGFYKGGSAVGDDGVGPVQAIKNALESDMGKFADEAGGQSKAAWKKANAFYSKMVVPFKEAGLKQLVKTDEPAKAWRFLVQQSAGKARSQKMYLALDSQGRSAVRSGLIQDAIEHAKTPKGDVSPAKFAQYMEKHSNAVDTFFGGADLKEVKGFQNLMRHVERAGQYAENPPTGQRVIDTGVAVAAGAAILSPAMLKLMAVLAAGSSAVKGLFQTKAGRTALIAASKYKPGSKPMESTAKVLAALIATQSGKPEQPTKQE